MVEKILRYIFDHENLKTNSLVIVLILVLLGSYRIMTIHFSYVNDVIRKNNQAMLQQAISNEKLTGSVDKLTQVIDRKLK